MALIDRDAILNSNPTKRLRIAFENMKSNYTDSSANLYMETYKNQPLAFIIENSRYIFSEPIYGLKFYTESVLNNEYAFMFTEYENEKEKIESYIEENGNKMPEAQKKMYEDLLAIVTEKYNSSINTSTIISHACLNEETKTTYDTLVESVYSLKDNPEKFEDIRAFMESTTSADLFYAISPYIAKFNPSEVDYIVSSNMNRFFKECAIEDGKINEDEWKNYIESVVIVSKLYNDDIYKKAVSTMRRQNSIVFEGLASESVKDQINELFIEHITENAGANKFNANTFDCYYSTSVNAVNRIFEDDYSYGMMREENEKIKMERTKLHEIAMNVLYEYVTHDYQTCDNLEDPIKGFNYFSEGTSVEEAFAELASSSFIVKEAVEEVSVSDTDETDVDDIDDEKTGAPSSKKVKAPSQKDLATKIQNKAMDHESEFLRKRAEKQQKGHGIKNAFKAVTAIPSNILNSIKQTAADFNKADDDRRKNYFIQPGYRKKIFRNLKVALMYGGAASAKLALVPIVAVARHFSKQKDRRIRNELARELDNEIRITEEKISDAAANGDTQSKYKLMRIKADLEKEAIRVKTNSRYI